MIQLIAQGIGFLALLFVLLSFQKNKRYLILLFMLVAQILFTIHFGLLGAWTGAAMNGIAGLRTYIFNQRKLKFGYYTNLWLSVFLVFFGILGFITWNGFYHFFLI